MSNRFAAHAVPHYRCPFCQIAPVPEEGDLCWRCQLWEDERDRAARGLTFGFFLGGLLWSMIVYVIWRAW